LFALPLLLAAFAPWLAAQKTATLLSGARTDGEKKSPAELGMDGRQAPAGQSNTRSPRSTWVSKRPFRTVGAMLGPLPKQRRATNGIILATVILSRSSATRKPMSGLQRGKSFFSTVCGLAVAQGLIQNVNDPVAKYIHDGRLRFPHNAKITWKNHLQQASEWEGAMWAETANFWGSRSWCGAR